MVSLCVRQSFVAQIVNIFAHSISIAALTSTEAPFSYCSFWMIFKLLPNSKFISEFGHWNIERHYISSGHVCFTFNQKLQIGNKRSSFTIRGIKTTPYKTIMFVSLFCEHYTYIDWNRPENIMHDKSSISIIPNEI